MEQEKIEEEFRKSSSKQIQNAKRRFISGIDDLSPESPEDSGFEKQELLDSAGEKFAFASEIALKSNIIYDDFRRNIRFNQINRAKIHIDGKEILAPNVGSNDWHRALAGDIANFKFIQSPYMILKMICENNPQDERVLNIQTVNAGNPFFKLTYDGKEPSGHSLYAYYQLQSPIVKSLINTDFFCYVDDVTKYTIYALLTEDIMPRATGENSVISEDFMKKLDKVKDAAVNLRYASISSVNIKPEELSFLKEFSSSVISVGEYRFPLPKKYEQIDFNRFDYNDFFAKDYVWFHKLDKMTRYYLQSCFTKKEIEIMMQYIDRILKDLKTSPVDIEIFVNNCIYFKSYIKNKLKYNLEFTNAQYSRIHNFCNSIKAFQPFSSNGKRLRYNREIQKKKKYYIEQVKIAQNQEIQKDNNPEIADTYGFFVAPDNTIWMSRADYLLFASSQQESLKSEEEFEEDKKFFSEKKSNSANTMNYSNHFVTNYVEDNNTSIKK